MLDCMPCNTLICFWYSVGSREHLRDQNTTGNWGIQDQRLGLQWVQDNIAAFGGDPTKVLLLGNSAGASSVAHHMVSKHSKGLFQRAGLNSGAFEDWGYKPLKEATAVFAAVAKALNCSDPVAGTAACLRRQSTLDLMRLADRTQGALPYDDLWGRSQWAPVVDGVELTASPLQLLKDGAVPPSLPVLMGTNKDDGTEFIASSDTMIGGLARNTTAAGFRAWVRRNFRAQEAAVMQLYAGIGEKQSYWWAATKVLGDFIMTCPHRRAARLLAAQRARLSGVRQGLDSTSTAVYRYYFTHVPLDARMHAGGLSGLCPACS